MASKAVDHDAVARTARNPGHAGAPDPDRAEPRRARFTRRVLIGTTAALVVVGASLTGADAQTRVESRAVTCRSLQDSVTRSGSLIVGTGPSLYDRYVADGQFCQATQSAWPSFVATRDTGSCLLYACRERSTGSSR